MNKSFDQDKEIQNPIHINLNTETPSAFKTACVCYQKVLFLAVFYVNNALYGSEICDSRLLKLFTNFYFDEWKLLESKPRVR